MSRLFEFSLSGRGLDGVRFLLARDDLPVNGDVETAFFDGLSGLTRHDGAAFGPALLSALGHDAPVLCLIRNPALVLDPDLPERIAAACNTLPEAERWALAGAGGLGLGDRRHLALYASANPAIPVPEGPQPLIDVMPDLTLVNAPFARAMLERAPSLPDVALEPVLAAAGYLEDRVSIFLPGLSAGIDGDLLARDLTRLTDELTGMLGPLLPGQSIVTLSGPVTLPFAATTAPSVRIADRITSVVARAARPPSLSIVTRTRFDRPALLRRLLTSLSRARPDRFELEVLLATDIAPGPAQDAWTALKRDFRNLDLRLCRSAVSGPSRVANLVCGIEGARHDYVAVIDDDDYVDLFAFDSLQPAFFLGNRPLVITDSAVHQETWEHPAEGGAVLTASAPLRTYPGARWRTLFGGVNALPVSAMVMPRRWLVRRLAQHAFGHDLSEDYAVFLLLLTDPDLPAVFETGQTFSHISVRGAENTVTMPDRRPWVRDISGHLRTLTGNDRVAGPGLWALLSGERGAPATARGIADLSAALSRREQDIRLLTRENAALRAQLSRAPEVAS